MEPDIWTEIFTQMPALAVLIWSVMRLTGHIDKLNERIGEHVRKSSEEHARILQHVAGQDGL